MHKKYLLGLIPAKQLLLYAHLLSLPSLRTDSLASQILVALESYFMKPK